MTPELSSLLNQAIVYGKVDRQRNTSSPTEGYTLRSVK
jgi:hypothetical protein